MTDKVGVGALRPKIAIYAFAQTANDLTPLRRRRALRPAPPGRPAPGPGAGVLVGDDVRRERLPGPEPVRPLPDQRSLEPALQRRRLARHLRPVDRARRPEAGSELAPVAARRRGVPAHLAPLRHRQGTVAGSSTEPAGSRPRSCAATAPATLRTAPPALRRPPAPNVRRRPLGRALSDVRARQSAFERPFSILSRRMASDRATLKAQPRTEFGSRTSRRLRRDGLVPGVVYGAGVEARAFQVGERDVRNVLVHGGALIDVEIEGSTAVPAVIKEQQRDPVRGDLVHLDLQEVNLKIEIQADVAIELVGADDAPGVKEGGVLEHVTHEITISALPTEIPESIPADVSGMEINDTLQLSSLIAPRGGRVRPRRGPSADEVTIATLSPPRVEEEPETEIEEEAELVGEEGEVAEGEEPAAESGDESGDDDSGDDSGGVVLRLFAAAPRSRAIAFCWSASATPASRYARTRHNVGFEVAERARAPLGAAEGRAASTAARSPRAAIRPGGPRVAPADPADLHERVRRGRRTGARRAAHPARSRDRDPRRDRPAVRRGADQARRRRRRPQRSEEPARRLRLERLLARAGRRRAPRLDRPRDRLRPRPRPLQRARGRGARADRRGRRRDRAPD